MQTLLTGFGPFGSMARNPSARIVKHFARTGAPRHVLTAHVLPVSYARAETAIGGLLGDGPYDAAVLLGVAQREACIRLEQFAHRRAAGREDVDGAAPARLASDPDGPAFYRTTLPLELLHARLTAAGLPARVSEDAGDYLCNYVYYLTLAALSTAQLPVRCLFVHVPPDEQTFDQPFEGPMLPFARQIEAVTLILEWLLEQGPASSPEALPTRSGA
jgi:pyroglutamyl-peptidase